VIKLQEHEFKRLIKFIYDKYGIDLSKKHHLIEGRLQGVLVNEGCSTFNDYIDKVLSDQEGKYLTQIMNYLTTNHTYFMREFAHFEYYRDVVLPQLQKKRTDRSIGVWSAGCSSGQEPYTISVINDMFFGNIKNERWDTRMLASDISEKVLGIAQKGIYSEEDIKVLPDEYKRNYLERVPEGFKFRDSIRDNIIFKKINLMDDFHFKRKFDVIFCRNVMIYFDKETKLDLVNRFYEVTEPGGYLFIGHSEFLEKDRIKYEYVKPAVYRKPIK